MDRSKRIKIIKSTTSVLKCKLEERCKGSGHKNEVEREGNIFKRNLRRNGKHLKETYNIDDNYRNITDK
jgi:hypothetical protein